MQRLANLLRESAAFVLTREHWRSSIPLIVFTIILLIASHELDGILESTHVSVAASFINLYLMQVVFAIAWYRRVITTEKVEIDYRFTRRTSNYLAGCVLLAVIAGGLILLPLLIVVAASASIPFALPDTTIPVSLIIGGGIVIIYVMVRFEFILAAAATDSPLTLGQAWDLSRTVQWPMFGAVLAISGLATLVGYLLPDSDESSTIAAAYLIETIGQIWSFVVQAFTIAVTGIAYRQAQQSGFSNGTT